MVLQQRRLLSIQGEEDEEEDTAEVVESPLDQAIRRNVNLMGKSFTSHKQTAAEATGTRNERDSGCLRP